MAKIGAEHASAMARQGLRELRNVFYPESNVATQTEYGVYGTKTPGEVAHDREGNPERDEEPQKSGSIVDSRIDRAKAQPARDQDASNSMDR